MKPELWVIVFLLTAALAVGASCTPYAVAKKPFVPHDRIIIVSPLTHIDWMAKPGTQWGPAGVKHMLDRCKEAGVSKVLWRVFDSGRTYYKSSYRDPMGPGEKFNYFNPETEAERALTGLTRERGAQILKDLEKLDYSNFDTLSEAVEYGHSIGLEMHAWFSINEDDHGWGWPSRFAKAHPEMRWRKRDGTFYHSQVSFAYKQVRDYKLAEIREVVKNYNIDGVFLDWIRTGDIRDNPQTDSEGVANYGYEDINVRGFKKQYGIEPKDVSNGDDRWVRYRAKGSTEFMRSVRKMMKSTKPQLPLSVMVAHPWGYRGAQNLINGNLRGLLLDVETWGNEGLMDSATPMGYYINGGTPAMAYESLKKEVGDKIDIWYFGWIPGSPDAFVSDYYAAKKLGASSIMFWEADYLDNPGHDEARAAMNARAYWPD